MTGFLAPERAPLYDEFWDATSRGEFVMPQCVSGDRFFVPEPVCPVCLTADWGWVPCAGRGRLYSWSVVHRAPVPEVTEPYVVAVVDLDEGWTLMTHLVGVEEAELRVDLPVRLVLSPAANGFVLPLFTAAEAAS